MTNSNQLVIWAGGYYPFGEIYEEAVSSSNYHHFPGQYRDAQTDLRYNWHRYYNPELGQYYQADPIGLNGGVNLYAYVGANPLRRIDPAGLDYYETPNGDLVWVESTEMYLPSVGKWRGRVLRDVYGEIVDYRIDPFIPNYSDNYHGCGEEILNKEIGNNPLQIYDSWTNKGPFDIKNQPPFSEGQLVIVDGRIYRSEDLGNMLFGVFAQNSVYPMVLMELGGGIVQALKDGKVHFEWWRTALDDQRGSYFVNRGRIQADVWNNERRLPH